ncbi:hypothetical protein JCM14076_10620 [Methylosoma difficile]
MSNEENVSQAEEAVAAEAAPAVEALASNAAGNFVSTLMDLKEKNPKVFFGAVGGVVVLLLVVMMAGGDGSAEVKGPVIKDLVIGQRYTLKSANAYDPGATVRLVSVPGAMEAYDDSEEADRSGACQHIPQGTPVSVLELQDMYGKKNAFVKVQMEEGECKGNSGWALGIDVQ